MTSDHKIDVIREDITKLEVDAIVNAANSRLAGGGGVDGAIHAAAGPRLIEACRAIGGCPTGEARITPGFDLSARWVIHAVGPVWKGGGFDEEKLLRLVYVNSFHLALEHSVGSIAFPAISTGVYAFPKDRAAEIATTTMASFADRFDRVVACCFSEEDVKTYFHAMSAL